MKRAVVESRFNYKGYPCVVLLQRSCHRCGYVGVPKSSILYNLDYMAIDIPCHGGLTYSRSELFGQEDENIWWLGFDCAHYGDGYDYDAWLKYFPEDKERVDSLREIVCNNNLYLTKADVEHECKNIVDYIISVYSMPN